MFVFCRLSLPLQRILSTVDLRWKKFRLDAKINNMATGSKQAFPAFVLPSRLCRCGRLIEGLDPHPVCIICLELQHAVSAVTLRDCELCANWSDAVLLRRLAAANTTGQADGGDARMGRSRDRTTSSVRT